MHTLPIALSLLLAFGNAPSALSTAATGQARSAPPADADKTQGASGDSEAPQTPEGKAASAAYHGYARALVHALSVSTDARDRALATQMMWLPDAYDGHEPTAVNKALRGTMLRDAAESAPDDALVQWFWAEAPARESGCYASNPCPHRAEAAVRLQPDNAAVWLPVFNAAWDAKDVPAAESVLGRMALASRFDDQMGMALKAWVEVYTRYPMPKSVVAAGSADAKYDDHARGFAASMALAAATAIPPYQSLVTACSRERHTDASALRLRDCAAVGRLMMTQATSLISRQIGRAVLRVSGQATAADISSARNLDWLYLQWTTLVFAGTQDDEAHLKAAEQDWQETGDETLVIQRNLKRSGIALNPPVNWQPTGRDGKPTSALGEPLATAK